MEISFKKKNYRKIIRELVEDLSAKKGGMSFTKLAGVCKMQRTYLSQVMNLKNHLSGDQLFAICEALDLSPTESRFLMLLSELERSKNPERKAHLQKKIGDMESRQSGQEASRILGSPQEALDDYFCDPIAEVVLNFFRLEAYARNPTKVREVLGLTNQRWEEVMKTLRECQFISMQKDQIKVTAGYPIPDEQTPADRIRHIMARMRVTQQKLKQRNIDDFLYNSWFVTSHEAKKQLKISHLHLLRKIYQESQQTSQEKIYQLTLDILSF